MDVLTTKDALPNPAGTKTVAGTVATVGSVLERLTVMPPWGALAFRKTDAEIVVPALTVDWLRLTPPSRG